MLVALGVTVLVVLAVRADSAAPLQSWLLTGVDVLVGLAFVVAAAVAPGPPMERCVVASVGAAWLVGSFLPVARALHQGVLPVALGSFASGRPRGPVLVDDGPHPHPAKAAAGQVAHRLDVDPLAAPVVQRQKSSPPASCRTRPVNQQRAALGRRLTDIQHKIASLIAAIESGVDPTLLGQQFATRTAEKDRILRDIGRLEPEGRCPPGKFSA